MPFDAVCLTAMLREIEPVVTGARIDRIFQPTRNEVVLSLRSRAGNTRLLLTANPSQPRIQLTAIPRENPASPPMFCMLLRRHLSGARIVSVTQPPMERVADIELEATDELGDRAPRHLILEAIHRHANLILTDADGRIVDCLRRVDVEMSPKRQVLPGLYYRLPPAREGLENLSDLTEERLSEWYAAAPSERRVTDFLSDHIGGLSPLICRELAFDLTGDADGRLEETEPEALSRLVLHLAEEIREGHFTPMLLVRDGKPADFTYRAVAQYGPGTENRRFDRFSDLLDFFYAQRENDERIRRQGEELLRSVRSLRARTARRLDAQRRELTRAEGRDQLRIQGDLITANLYAMHRGMGELVCQNYYDPEEGEIRIPLDPLLTPQQNAAAYYRRYNKAKTAQRVLTEQIGKGEADLDYLDSVLTCIRCSSEERDLTEIRRELEEGGYLRAKKDAKKRMKQPKTAPLEFRSDAGLRISVGRNNGQNDQLTLKTAGRDDLWLHVKDIHGAHVILWTGGREPDAESVLQAAQLAAWFSQGREEKNVAVDCAPVRFVKKPAGAKPGKVIYTHYSTLRVTPDRETTERLSAKNRPR